MSNAACVCSCADCIVAAVNRLITLRLTLPLPPGNRGRDSPRDEEHLRGKHNHRYERLDTANTGRHELYIYIACSLHTIN